MKEELLMIFYYPFMLLDMFLGEYDSSTQEAASNC